jgi:hypothetical protein
LEVASGCGDENDVEKLERISKRRAAETPEQFGTIVAVRVNDSRAILVPILS